MTRALGYEVEYDKNGSPYHKDSVIAGHVITWVFPYSTDISEAWKLAKQLALDHEFFITNYKTERTCGWCANYRKYQQEWASVDADTAPLAITRAYLKAHGIEFVEVPE